VLVYFSTALIEINTKRRAKQLVFGIVIFGTAMAFFGIAQDLINPGSIYGLRPTPQAISFGPFVNRHHFAGFMEMTIGLTLSILLCGGTKPDKRSFLIFAVAVMGVAAVMISSRGGMLSIAGVTAFVIAASFFAKRKSNESANGSTRAKLTVAAAAIALVLGIFGTVIFLGSGDAVIRGIGASETADVSNGRFHFWSVSAKIIAADPIIGVGFDAFGSAFTKFDSWNGTYRIEQAHNDYIQMLTDGGMVGFAFIAVFIWLFLRNGLRNISNASEGFHRSAVIGSFAGCLGIMIHSFFDFPLRTNSNLFFFVLLVSVAMLPKALFSHHSRRRSNVNEPSQE
jgi:O-antigen ligase